MTTIAMCADHHASRVVVEGANVVTASHLCWRPGQLEAMVPADETSLLLALHGSEIEMGRVQASVRRMGFDALGVGVLDLERLDDDDESLTPALVALAARMDAYPGSRPGQVKLARRPSRTTRRSLLSLGTPTYTGAPMIDESRCVAHDGCRACANECPADSLTWADASVTYDKTACIACGVCITTCPTGAVVNPVATPEAVEAEIRAAVAAATEPIGIRYVCRAGRAPFERGWHQVEVPCTAMLTVGWLLAPLLIGAGAVTSLTCDESGCEVGLSSRVTAALREAAVVLTAIGIDATRLDGCGHHPPLVTEPAPPGVLGPGSTQRSIAALHVISGIDPGWVPLGHADVGSVEIDTSSCTACEMCANVCPTDALSSVHDADGVRIDFEPRQCVACGQCITVCPEIDRGAIRLARGFDPDDWSRGRRQVRHEAVARCERCGKPVAPTAMLDRISTILGEDHPGTIELIGKRCIECRGR